MITISIARIRNERVPIAIDRDSPEWIAELKEWNGKLAYHEGLFPAHYPVPAIYYSKTNWQWWQFRMKFDARYK